MLWMTISVTMISPTRSAMRKKSEGRLRSSCGFAGRNFFAVPMVDFDQNRSGLESEGWVAHPGLE